MKTIAIVGRPNVGKSRLFNRIVGRRTSIVHDQPGVTRDRLERIVDHGDGSVRWIDTGGIGLTDDFAEMITLQAGVAIEAADAIVLVVDAIDGLMPLDQEIAGKLRGRKPVVLAVNKVDHPEAEHDWADFAGLGFKDVVTVSAEHGRGVSDLIQGARRLAGPDEGEDEPAPFTRVAIVGRPNAGKSSLLNAILGEERTIVSHIPGTTRDAIEASVDLPDGRIMLVDTAGIRKKRQSFTLLENVMVGRTRQAVERSDVAIVVTDAVAGLAEQDVRIVSAVMNLGKGAVIALNKWDAVETKDFDKQVDRMKFLLGSEAHVPVVSISALKGQRVRKLLEAALKVGRNAQTRIRTADLNRILADAARRAPRGTRIKYGIQRSIMPPNFVIFGSDRPPRTVVNYLRNSLRDCGGFVGVPIVLEFHR